MVSLRLADQTCTTSPKRTPRFRESSAFEHCQLSTHVVCCFVIWSQELIGAANGIRLFNRVKKEKGATPLCCTAHNSVVTEARAALPQVTAPVDPKQPENPEAKQPPPDQKPVEQVKPADPPVVKPADNPAAVASGTRRGFHSFSASCSLDVVCRGPARPEWHSTYSNSIAYTNSSCSNRGEQGSSFNSSQD